MTMTFGWKNGARHKVSPQIAGEHLASLREQNGGALTARIVVNDAQAPVSPLHSEFVWNDAEAADQYRLEQARGLLRSLVVIRESERDDGEPRTHRAYAFVTPPVEESSGDTESAEPTAAGAYVAMDDALGDPRMRAQILARAKDEFASARRRYAGLQELAGVFAAIDALAEPEPIEVKRPARRKRAA